MILAIDSSTALASVCLFRDGQCLGEEWSFEPKGHSEFINPAIEKLLTKAGANFLDLKQVAVCIGPGSFTGVRVAVNVARTIAYSLGIPVIARQSLHLLLDQIPQDGVALINAYRNSLFFSLKVCGKIMVPSSVVQAHELENHLSRLGIKTSLMCVGDGYDAYSNLFSEKLKGWLVRDPTLSDFPSASQLARVASSPCEKLYKTLDWKSIVPLYLKLSSAEEKRRGER